MPVVIKEPEGVETGDSLGEAKLLASSKIESFPSDMEIKRKASTKNELNAMKPITPKTDFAMRQANHLVERICRDNGVEAPKYSFSKCSPGQEDLIVSLSATKHASVLRLAEYLHKRGQIERDYAISIQKLNRHLIQTGDTDERLGQLIVMGEKTAAGHMDWARKISEERIIEDLKTLCSENEEQRKYLLGEMKKHRGVWSKAVVAFEKVRKNRDRAQKAADSAQLAFDSAVARGNSGKNALARLKEDAQLKGQKAKQARDEYNRAMVALTARQGEIFKEQIPQCLDGLEKMERTRMAAVRASLINLAQVHMAVADIEIESGQRWLKSLVSLSVDDEIEIFVRNVEERAEGLKILEEIQLVYQKQEQSEDSEDENEEEASGVISSSYQNLADSTNSAPLYSNSTLTNSEADLLKALPEIEEINDPRILQERQDKLEKIQVKLAQQIEALERMEAAYGEADGPGNKATLEAVKASKQGIAHEIEENSLVLEQIKQKLSLIAPIRKRSGIFKFDSPNNGNNALNQMTSILEELNRLDQRRLPQQQPINDFVKKADLPKKRELSRSFEDILREGEIEGLASPKATGLKLPGAQWTAESINKSNEEISITNTGINGKMGDYFCAADEEYDEEEEERNSDRIEEIVLNQRRNFRTRLSSIDSESYESDERSHNQTIYDDNHSNNTNNNSKNNQDQISPSLNSPTGGNGRRKSIGQSTKNLEATEANQSKSISMIPKNSIELFKVQALYNFIGRKETDELDLCTGEILDIYEANGEWWEAENEAGVRGYIPFNYVIRI